MITDHTLPEHTNKLPALAGGTHKRVAHPTLRIRPNNLVPTGDASGHFPCGVISQTRQYLAGSVGFRTQAHNLVDRQAAITNEILEIVGGAEALKG